MTDIRLEIGDLGKVTAARRVSGPGASFVMAPFVHCSTLRPGRFSDGSYGLYYAGDSEDLFAHGSVTTTFSSEANALAPELRQIGNGFSGRIKKPKNLMVEAS